MHPWIRAVLTAAMLIPLTWPLLFWGQPALPNHECVTGNQPTLLHKPQQRPEPLW